VDMRDIRDDLEQRYHLILALSWNSLNLKDRLEQYLEEERDYNKYYEILGKTDNDLLKEKLEALSTIEIPSEIRSEFTNIKHVH